MTIHDRLTLSKILILPLVLSEPETRGTSKRSSPWSVSSYFVYSSILMSVLVTILLLTKLPRTGSPSPFWRISSTDSTSYSFPLSHLKIRPLCRTRFRGPRVTSVADPVLVTKPLASALVEHVSTLPRPYTVLQVFPTPLEARRSHAPLRGPFEPSHSLGRGRQPKFVGERLGSVTHQGDQEPSLTFRCYLTPGLTRPHNRN